VADVGNQQIRAFDLVSGALLRSMTAPGLALTDFSNLDVHDDGRLFVADTGNRRVLVFSPEGALVGGFESREGPGGPLRKPIDVKLDGDRLYVVGNNRVQSFQLD
jgi:DNA-binding beta-propeller fold protein YncE